MNAANGTDGLDQTQPLAQPACVEHPGRAAAAAPAQAQGGAFRSRYAGQTVLALGAHPDDLELGVAGTLARLRHFGARVVMAVACVPDSPGLRIPEARAGAAVLGAELRVLVSERCCRVEDLKTYELVGMLDALIREFSPSAVFSHGPGDFHKDHVLVYNAILSSLRLKPADLFCYPPTSTRPTPVDFLPRAFVDISDFIELKMRALHAHASQFQGRSLPTDWVREHARVAGRRIGVEYAETLEVVRMLLV